MITDELKSLICQNFAHKPTPEQKKVIEMWSEFLLFPDDEHLFLLRGYAGTGKTSLVGALVRTLEMLKQKVVLLAPTGRAAKVMASYADYPASTIHRHIYRQRTFGQDVFTAAPNMEPHTVFIVDEASMISNDGLSGSIFGDGRLLDDLIHYVYSAEGCRLIMIGDTAQLPPVGEELSPALDTGELGGYGLTVMSMQLTQVVRQMEDSGILWNATELRMRLLQNPELPKINLNFPDISIVSGYDLIDSLEQSYSNAGRRGTIVVTHSNKRANIYNMGIRNHILDYEEELCGGDHIMVAKNKYMKREGDDGKLETELIANGEMAIVKKVRHIRDLYGFRFADVRMQLLDHDGEMQDELETTVLMTTLHSEAPALAAAEQQQLFLNVCADYPELTNKRDLYKAVRENEHYGALQIKYAYAITCHKAQGGQWEDVYIDQGYMTEDMLSEDYLRWLYTAITRAASHVYLVNWPEEQIEN